MYGTVWCRDEVRSANCVRTMILLHWLNPNDQSPFTNAVAISQPQWQRIPWCMEAICSQINMDSPGLGNDSSSNRGMSLFSFREISGMGECERIVMGKIVVIICFYYTAVSMKYQRLKIWICSSEINKCVFPITQMAEYLTREHLWNERSDVSFPMFIFSTHIDCWSLIRIGLSIKWQNILMNEERFLYNSRRSIFLHLYLNFLFVSMHLEFYQNLDRTKSYYFMPEKICLQGKQLASCYHLPWKSDLE